MPENPLKFLSSMSSHVSDSSAYKYERCLFSVTKQYAQQMRERERKARKRRETLQDIAELLRSPKSSSNPIHNNSRQVKKQKMMRRCSLEWEYLANIIDRFLLFLFCFITVAFFLLLVFFDVFFKIDY